MGIFDRINHAAYERVEHLLGSLPSETEIVFYAQIEQNIPDEDDWKESYEEYGLLFLTATEINLQPLDNPTVNLPIKGLHIRKETGELNIYTDQARYELEHITSLTKLAPHTVFLPLPAQAAAALHETELDYIWNLLLNRGAVAFDPNKQIAS